MGQNTYHHPGFTDRHSHLFSLPAPSRKDDGVVWVHRDIGFQAVRPSTWRSRLHSVISPGPFSVTSPCSALPLSSQINFLPPSLFPSLDAVRFSRKPYTKVGHFPFLTVLKASAWQASVRPPTPNAVHSFTHICLCSVSYEAFSFPTISAV